MDYKKLSLEKHKYHNGKLTIKSKVPLTSRAELATYYTPWVAAPCLAIAKDQTKAYTYTWKSNSVAIISDWSAVLWLGNIGGLAGLPVMEWKAILFKKFGNVDAVPIVTTTQDPKELINLIENIAPSFWWINLEDIKAPGCFYIEEELKKRLKIPVFHDDQHGTAIVVLAWLINALKLTQKKIEQIKIVISWAWAAGIAIAKLLISYGAQHIIMTDSKGILHHKRKDMNEYKKSIAKHNKDNIEWDLHTAIIKADVFIWVSQPWVLKAADIKNMANHAIVFAMSNPNPEITPEEAKKWGAYIIATGRSDFPNQINNVLAFPWLFRGALDKRIEQFTEKHFIAAAKAIAWQVKSPSPSKIIPSIFTPKLSSKVAEIVKK